LGGLDKITAAGHLAENIRTFEKVPPFIKAGIASFKQFYDEIVEMIKELKGSLDSLKTKG